MRTSSEFFKSTSYPTRASVSLHVQLRNSYPHVAEGLCDLYSLTADRGLRGFGGGTGLLQLHGLESNMNRRLYTCAGSFHFKLLLPDRA